MQQRMPLRNEQGEVSFAEYLRACLLVPKFKTQTKRTLSSVNNLSRVFDNVPLDEQYLTRPLAFLILKKRLEKIMKELKDEIDAQKLDTIEKLAQYVPSEKIQKNLSQCLNDAVVLACREMLDSHCKNLKPDILAVLRELDLNEKSDDDPYIDAKIKSQIVSSYFNMYLLSSVMNHFLLKQGVDVTNPFERQKYESVIQRAAQELSRGQDFFNSTLEEETLKITRSTNFAIYYLNSQGDEQSESELQRLLEKYPEFKETGVIAKYSGWFMHFKSYPDLKNVLSYVGENYPMLANEIISAIKSTFTKTFPIALEMKEEHRVGMLGSVRMNDAATFASSLKLLEKLGRKNTVKRLIKAVLGGNDVEVDDKNIELVFQRLCEKEYGVTQTQSAGKTRSK